MKLVRCISIAPIIFCVLIVAAMADSKQKREIKFPDHITVSTTQLEPGEYVVRWEGSGPGVQLKFMHEGEEVASVSGKLIQQKNRHNSFTTDQGENGSRVLTEIDFSDVTLVLTPAEASIAQ